MTEKIKNVKINVNRLNILLKEKFLNYVLCATGEAENKVTLQSKIIRSTQTYQAKTKTPLVGQ